MGTMVGTVITVKELYGIKSADIQFRNGTNSTPLITLEENWREFNTNPRAMTITLDDLLDN